MQLGEDLVLFETYPAGRFRTHAVTIILHQAP